MTEPELYQDASGWSCQTCTYLNNAADAICMLCNTAQPKADDTVRATDFDTRRVDSVAESI